MGDLNPQDAYLLDKVTDPKSAEFDQCMQLLVKPQDDGVAVRKKLNSKGDWKYTMPYRGDAEDELEVRSSLPFRFAERGQFRNGILSLAVTFADIIDLVELCSNRTRMTPSVVVSSEFDAIKSVVSSAGSISTLVFYTGLSEFVSTSLAVVPETLVFDHTTCSMPIDKLLSSAYRLGIKVVDGVFPYHVAALKGWDVVTGTAKWSYTHTKDVLIVGPDDDATRMIKYKGADYRKFTDPSSWSGNARKYGYEIRKLRNGLATYRAVYLGGQEVPLPPENLAFSLPVCSQDDMVLVTVNRDLAAGVYTSKSNNAQDLASLQKDYAIEVRRDLFVSCVDFLIAKDKGSDIVGEAIRYIHQHNYVDLVDGIKIVRCHSLKYADALCVAMVCSLTAFSLRYRLTNESLPDINRSKSAAEYAHNAPLGALGRLVWYFATAVADRLFVAYQRTRKRAAEVLYSTDYIPGVCYNVYVGSQYTPDLDWFEPYEYVVKDNYVEFSEEQAAPDAFTSFLGDNEKTSAPSVVAVKTRATLPDAESKYVANLVVDPIATLQHFYDEALPGNSTAQIQNASELRRVKDININTEFYGKLEVGKDVAAPEQLHRDMDIRTSAIAPNRTPLVDAILASAKRNFNPPDLQTQSDPWSYSKYLADQFIEWAFAPNFSSTIGKAYRADPLTFNVCDYLEWRAMKDTAYRSAMEAECPEDIVELELEKYDTIIKKRVKPKLSAAAQSELAQPQVIVSMSKRDTALFTSVFRKVFERLDSALRPEICSAGRMSDDSISDWLTKNMSALLALPALELDSSKYDKSQGLLARLIESHIMIHLGLDPQVLEIFGDSYVGKVSSKALGLCFVSSYQMKSGAPHTMLGNILYNFVSAMESVGKKNIRFMIAKGDDNLVWVVHDVDRELAVSKMSSLFNLEVKLISNSVLYFSSGYVVSVDDKLLFVPDPLKIVELLGEPVSSERTLAEQYVSFQDRIKSLVQHHAVPLRLQELVRARLGQPSVDVVSAVDALSAVASSYGLFEKIKKRN